MDKKAFTPCVLNSSMRAEIIKRASQRILFCAPGMSKCEAQALEGASERLSSQSIHVLVDLSPHSFRSGYWGDMVPADLLAMTGCLLGQAGIANGLRLGLLVVDDQAWIYVPTAQSIEAEALESSEPNALMLNSAMAQSLLDSILRPADQSEKGRPEITEQAIHTVQSDLGSQNESQPRIKRMLEAIRPRLQIIQFDVRGYKINQRTIRLPREMIDIIGSSDRQINERINADWRVFLDNTNVELEIQQKQVERSLNHLKEVYLVRLGQYGFGLLQSERTAFEEAWKNFYSDEVEKYKRAINERIGDLVSASKEQLLKLLKERAKNGTLNIPRQRMLFTISEEQATDHYLSSLLDRVVWPTPESVTSGIVIDYHSYDISENLLADPKFRALLEKQFGSLNEWFDQVEKQNFVSESPSHTFYLN